MQCVEERGGSIDLSADLAVATAGMPTRTTRDDSRIRLEWHAGRYFHLVHERSSQHRADLAAKQLAILNEALAGLMGA
jgi:hypothetical protein